MFYNTTLPLRLASIYLVSYLDSQLHSGVVFLGIIEPIKSGIRDARLGLGKQEEDDYFTAEENIQRRKLDIEVEETEELVKKREVCLLTFATTRKKKNIIDIDVHILFNSTVLLLLKHASNSRII